MTMKNERDRKVCAVQVCRVEIHPEDKYCSGHQYFVETWIKLSMIVLAKAVKAERKE